MLQQIQFTLVFAWLKWWDIIHSWFVVFSTSLGFSFSRWVHHSYYNFFIVMSRSNMFGCCSRTSSCHSFSLPVYWFTDFLTFCWVTFNQENPKLKLDNPWVGTLLYRVGGLCVWLWCNIWCDAAVKNVVKNCSHNKCSTDPGTLTNESLHMDMLCSTRLVRSSTIQMFRWKWDLPIWESKYLSSSQVFIFC